MRKRKIPIEKVQKAFNDAIKRRDGKCMINDFDSCCGQLECSHYLTVGSSPSLRFYPLNAYAQCQKHHWKHHNVTDGFIPYDKFLELEHRADIGKLYDLKNRYIKYDDELKAEIIRLCNEDKLEELKKLIEENLK